MKQLLITIGFIILFSYCAISQEQNDSISTVNKIDYGFYNSIGDSIIFENLLLINEQDKEIDLKRTELLNRNVTMLGFGFDILNDYDVNAYFPIMYSIWIRVADNLYVIPKFSLLISTNNCFSLAFSVGKKFIMSDNYLFYTSLGMSYMIKGEIFRFRTDDKYFLTEIDLYLSRKVYENIYVNLGLSMGSMIRALHIGVSF